MEEAEQGRNNVITLLLLITMLLLGVYNIYNDFKNILDDCNDFPNDFKGF